MHSLHTTQSGGAFRVLVWLTDDAVFPIASYTASDQAAVATHLERLFLFEVPPARAEVVVGDEGTVVEVWRRRDFAIALLAKELRSFVGTQLTDQTQGLLAATVERIFPGEGAVVQVHHNGTFQVRFPAAPDEVVLEVAVW